jgi:hypothetical protein
MYWERVMRSMEREKRSPPARITLWRQVGHCSLSWNVFIKLFGCSPWLVAPLLDGSSHPYPFLKRLIVCVGAPRGTGLWIHGRALRRGLTYRCIPQHREHHFPTNSEQSPELRLRQEPQLRLCQKDSVLSRSGITNSVGSHSF